MKNIFLLIILLVCSISSIKTQDFINNYGNNDNNQMSVVKSFGNGVYTAGTTSQAGITYATVTKFDVNGGAVIWQIRLNVASIVTDFEWIPANSSTAFPDEGLLIIGRTIGSSPTVNNSSFIWRVKATDGSKVFFRQYDHTGVESFEKIIRHSMPLSASFPYYILGRKNPSFPITNTNSFKTFLYNLNSDGIVNWGVEYNPTNPLPSGTEHHFFKGLFELKSGAVVLTGTVYDINSSNIDNYGWGLALIINGANGSQLNPTNHISLLCCGYDITDGIETPSGKLILVGRGRGFSPVQVEGAAIITPDFGTGFQRIFSFFNIFKRVVSNNSNELYTIGRVKSGPLASRPTLFKFDQSPSGAINPLNNATLNTGVFPYSNESLHFRSDINKIIVGYTTSGSGQDDIHVIKADHPIVSSCVSNSNYVPDIGSFDGGRALTNATSITIPPFIDPAQHVNLSYNNTSICAPCILNVNFTHTPGNCGAVTFTPAVSGGTGTYTYSWDINCSAPLEYTGLIPTYTHTFPTSGMYDVCLTVTDASGTCIGSKTMTISVIKDNVKPVINCPGNLNLTTYPETCYALYGGVSATDSCGVITSITCVLTGATTGTFTNVPQIQYNKGFTMVTCTATDDSGNVSNPCTFTITVFDSEPPQIVCPNNISVAAPLCSNGAVVTFPSPNIYDNCPMWTSSCNYMSGDFFPCGNTVVTCTVTDMGGAIASCSFNVSVTCNNNCPNVTGTSLECGTAPNTYNYSVTILNPNPVSNVCTYSLSLPAGQGTINSSNITTTGNTTTISGALTPANNTIYIFNLSIVASCICQGNPTQTCNLSAILDNIEVLPAPPNIVCPDDVTLFTIPEECFSVFGGVTAFDNCDPFVDITCTLTGATSGVFLNEDELPYEKGITLVECIATDRDGATSQCSFSVTVVDNQAPTIVCPNNVTAQVTDCSNTAVVSFPAPLVSDNCPMVQYSCSHQSNDIFNCGNTIVTCTATDMAGNTASCSFQVAVTCNCVDVVSTAINCDSISKTYSFVINIVNNTGSGSSCNSVLNLDSIQGVILSQTTTWNGTNGTITGSIQTNLVAPFTFNLSVVSDCTCANGLSQNCTVDILYPITEVCNDFIIFDKVYGDTSNNIASGIKAFGDGIYVASKRSISGADLGIISKFNRITGLLIWETSIRLDSDEFFLGPINDFEYIPDEDALLVVGNKISGRVGSPPFAINQYASYLLKINCQTGNLIFYNQYPFKGRNFFTKVLRHPNPVNVQYPYYIVGFKNPDGNIANPTTIDRIILLNIDKNGIINFGREYNSAVAPTFFDDEFGRGIVALNNGNLLLLGNDSPNGDGVILQVNGANGIPVNGLLKGIGNAQRFSILDGKQLNDTTLVFVGERTDLELGFISLYNYNTQNFTLNHLQSVEYDYMNRFRNIYTDAYKNLYVIGQNKSGSVTDDHPVVHSFFIDQNRNLRGRFSNFLQDNNEQDYTEGFIHVSPEADRIYYVDSRLNTSNNFGQFDMLVGAYDLNLNNICQDTFTNKTTRIMVPTSNYSVSSFVLNIPNPSHAINTPPISYQCADFCGPNCNVTAAFEAIPVNCYEMQFNDLSSGGTAPYSYEWNFDCTGPVESTSPNPTWTFPASGTYNVCLTVTDSTGVCSSSIMQVVLVPPDQNNPTLNCPGDITLNTDINQCYATFGGVSATDTCDTSLNIVCMLTGATTGTFTNQGQLQYNKGVTVVTCTVADDSGNSVSCSFTVTVVDNQLPAIVCPQNRVVNAPFCNGGANVTFNPPQISDNCPMASFTCTHLSGDFFPCGTTVVICTATDMAGNTSSCSFNITVNCTCTNVVSTDIQCGSLPDTYNFSIVVQNLSGNGDSCNLNLTLDPAQGVVQNQQIGWNGTQATITGTVISLLPVPSFFNFSLTSTCICPDMTQTVCTTPIILIPPCCKSAYLTDEEICKEDSIYTISIGFNGSVTSIIQVNWYISFSDPCPTSVSDSTWLLYASVTSNSDTVDIYPSSLTSDHFCMYAVVSVADNPCTELITDIASFTLCEIVKCTLSSQEICYFGTPVTPSPITLTPINPSCTYNIEWLDSSGNPILGANNQLSYQPPALTYTGHPDSCRQNFTFAAEITGLCGPQICYSTITLVNDAAPYGNIIMDPFEQQPFCPGEDATLRFITQCHVVEGMEDWKWFKTITHNNQVPIGFDTINGMGLMNPILHTNKLQTDTWFAVKVSDGVCPSKIDTFFIDVYRNAVLTQFNAIPLDPCRTTGVNMMVNFISPDCPVIIEWYKDGIFLNSSTHATSPASFTFQYTGITGDYGGNYHVVLKNSCCPDQSVNSIARTINSPMKLVLLVPCNIKGGETSTLEASVLNASGCVFEWFNENGSLLGSSSALNVIFPGTYTVVATCGSCVLTGQYNLIECCPVSVDDNYLLNEITIFPNPTTGQLTVQFASNIEEDMALAVYDVLGREVIKKIIEKGSISHNFMIQDKAGIYIVQLTDKKGSTTQRKVIKIE